MVLRRILLALFFSASLAFAQTHETQNPFDAARKLLDPTFHPVKPRDRQELENQILEKIYGRSEPEKNPQLLFLAGGMGVGKSYLVEQMRAKGVMSNALVINPDAIRDHLPEQEKQNLEGNHEIDLDLHREASAMTELLIYQALKDRRSIIIDASMRDYAFHESLIEMVRKAHSSYTVGIMAVVTSSSTHQRRLEERAQTTRAVPDDLVAKSTADSIDVATRLATTVDRMILVSNEETAKIARWVENGIDQKRPKGLELTAILSQPMKKNETDDPNVRHIAFDIDWTMIGSSGGEKMIDIDKKMIVFPFIEEMIEQLAKHPNVRISFYSGGPIERNLYVLKKLRAFESSSFYDIAHRVLSFHQLASVNPQGRWFSERYKKDLRLVNSDLNRVVLVDDIDSFAMNGQNTNVLSIGERPENLTDTAALNREYEKRVIRVFQILNRALVASENDPSIFAKKVNEFENEKTNEAWTVEAKQLLSDWQHQHCSKPLHPLEHGPRVEAH